MLNPDAIPDARLLLFSLQVLRLQPSFLGDLREKPGPYLLVVMEGKRVIGPARPLEPAVRTFLPGNFPADPKQGSQ